MCLFIHLSNSYVFLGCFRVLSVNTRVLVNGCVLEIDHWRFTRFSAKSSQVKLCIALGALSIQGIVQLEC